MTEALTIVVHGESGVGKSWFADTAPAPRLILDVEGGVRFTPSKKVRWDVRQEPPSDAETVVVTVQKREVAGQAYQWLNSGQHPFRSVVIDSLTEFQKRIFDDLVGTARRRPIDWGDQFVIIDSLVRCYRDLVEHRDKPLEAVVFVCG